MICCSLEGNHIIEKRNLKRFFLSSVVDCLAFMWSILITERILWEDCYLSDAKFYKRD